MQLRPSLPVAFFVLLLAWPQGAEATPSEAPLSASTHLSEHTVASLKQLAASLEGKRSYALTERLDEIAGSDAYWQLLLAGLLELDRLGPEVARATVDFEYADLYARFKSPQLRPLLARTYAALTATFELTPIESINEAIIGTDYALEHGGVGALIDKLDAPARLRRYIRHIFRGNVALMCLPFVHEEASLRLELFAHAATGAETNLRLAGAMSPDPQLARDLLAQLRLEPIDLVALERRRDELEAARDSLREAQTHVPGFRLPPDPSFQD